MRAYGLEAPVQLLTKREHFLRFIGIPMNVYGEIFETMEGQNRYEMINEPAEDE